MILLLGECGDLQERLDLAGRSYRPAVSEEAALDILDGPEGGAIECVIVCCGVCGGKGTAAIRLLAMRRRELRIVAMVDRSEPELSAAALASGAAAILKHPFETPQLIETLAEFDTDRPPVHNRAADPFAILVAENALARRAIDEARQAAESSIPVLIYGESGVGKEVFAGAIHGASARAGGPFVAVNCGALPEGLVESILFGHERGAFTGAVEKRVGKFVQAKGGVLFLDEIGELSPEAQVKLLRAVQEGEVDPIGGARAVRTDVRLIAATNRDLEGAIAEGRFREDLFYRIGVFILTLPPLRERREDIIPLARRFAKRFAAAEKRPVVGLSPEVERLLKEAPWPGNIRQLENAVHRAVVVSGGDQLEVDDFVIPSAAATAAPAAEREDRFFLGNGHIRTMEEIEAAALEAALERYGGSMSEVARRLGISRSTLYRKLRGEAA